MTRSSQPWRAHSSPSLPWRRSVNRHRGESSIGRTLRHRSRRSAWILHRSLGQSLGSSGGPRSRPDEALRTIRTRGTAWGRTKSCTSVRIREQHSGDVDAYEVGTSRGGTRRSSRRGGDSCGPLGEERIRIAADGRSKRPCHRFRSCTVLPDQCRRTSRALRPSGSSRSIDGMKGTPRCTSVRR